MVSREKPLLQRLRNLIGSNPLQLTRRPTTPVGTALGVHKIYFIGIKGVAMSALALISQQGGMQVTGSDVAEEFITDKVLRAVKIPVLEGFAASHLNWQPDLVVVGTSWSKDNVEVAEAIRRKLPMITDSDLRGQLSRQRTTIAVTGVHGKSTTTALAAYAFSRAGLKPSYLVGTAAIPDLGANGHWDNGAHFVVEGDEYTKKLGLAYPKFLDLSPTHTIITSIEWEHVDVYRNVEELEQAFTRLAQQTTGSIIACTDWPAVVRAIEPVADRVVGYGVSPGADWQVSDYRADADGIRFSLRSHGRHHADLTMRLPGLHNALNATAVYIVGSACGIGQDVLALAIAEFRGLERRSEVTVTPTLTWVDDYGHHPTEVAVTLKAIRDRYPKARITCVFQPHMASRTAALLDQFAKSFSAVDETLIVDQFSSAREHEDGVGSKELADAIGRYHTATRYVGSQQAAAEYIVSHTKPGEVVVTMGAGDVYKVRELVMKH